jgi:hypothetical protein
LTSQKELVTDNILREEDNGSAGDPIAIMIHKALDRTLLADYTQNALSLNE